MILSKTFYKPRIQLYPGSITRTFASRLTHALRMLHLLCVKFRT